MSFTSVLFLVTRGNFVLIVLSRMIIALGIVVIVLVVAELALRTYSPIYFSGIH